MMRMYAVGTSLVCFELDMMRFWWSIWVKKKFWSSRFWLSWALVETRVWVRPLWLEMMYESEMRLWLWGPFIVKRWDGFVKKKSLFWRGLQFYMINEEEMIDLRWGVDGVRLDNAAHLWRMNGWWIGWFAVDFVRKWKPRTLRCQFKIH